MSVQASGRTVLVTGASSGIGRAVAQRFAQCGDRVFGGSRHPGSGENGVAPVQLDVRSEESVRRGVAQVLGQAGHIDVLVNNAGVMHEGFAEETAPEQAAAVFQTNFFGVARVTDAVLPGMRARRRGRIVNVGSLASWVGEPGESYYAASKAALARYTEALRHEVWHLGIRVSLVEPGAFATGVLQASATSRARIADYDGPRENAHRTLQKALRDGGDPDRVAALVQKIAAAASPRGRYGAGRGSFWVPRAQVLLPQRWFDWLLRRAYGLPS